MIDWFIRWAIGRAPHVQGVVTFQGDMLFNRYEFWRMDEWPDCLWDEHRAEYPDRPRKLPWWLPFNAFLHHWLLAADTPESFHDHPRWSITICLRGRIIERTPWSERLLKPGSFVFRSRKSIHAFEIPKGEGEAWTLFIVGRRKHRQNSYQVIPR